MIALLKQVISTEKASKGIIILGLIIAAFHIVAILGLIPIEFIWGGKLKSSQQLYAFESFSILINAILVFVVLVRNQKIQLSINPNLIKGILWAFTLLFTLNTIGNLLAESSIETLLATPITFVLAVLCLRLVIGSN